MKITFSRLRRIRSVDQLIRLADERRSVAFRNWDTPKPAAFLIGMPVRVAALFIRSGLYEYRKPETKARPRWASN